MFSADDKNLVLLAAIELRSSTSYMLFTFHMLLVFGGKIDEYESMNDYILEILNGDIKWILNPLNGVFWTEMNEEISPFPMVGKSS